MPIVQRISITIANSASISSVFSAGGGSLLGIYFPTGILGARVTLLKGSSEEDTMRAVYDETGVTIKPKLVANGWLALHPFLWSGVRYAQLQTVDDAGAPVVQNALRTLLVEIG
jgi:hypothetical protein